MKKSLLFLIAWMTLFCAVAQRSPKTPTHYLDDPYYFFAVFSTGDSLAYTRGNASVVKTGLFPAIMRKRNVQLSQTVLVYLWAAYVDILITIQTIRLYN